MLYSIFLGIGRAGHCPAGVLQMIAGRWQLRLWSWDSFFTYMCGSWAGVLGTPGQVRNFLLSVWPQLCGLHTTAAHCKSTTVCSSDSVIINPTSMTLLNAALPFSYLIIFIPCFLLVLIRTCITFIMYSLSLNWYL